MADEIGFASQEDDEEEAGGYPGLYWGTVTDNEDPRMLGCVKVNVPGVTRKETTWAWPMGMPGAGYAAASNAATGAGKGAFFVPRRGAIVLVGFIHGKLEEPFFFCGHYSLKGAPRIVQAQGNKADAANVRVLAETETFEVYILDTETEKKVVIQTIGGESAGGMIELDANDGSITLKAQRAIVLDAPAVSVDGLNLVLKNRPVSALGLSI